jgi:hypothetical protein
MENPKVINWAIKWVFIASVLASAVSTVYFQNLWPIKIWALWAGLTATVFLLLTLINLVLFGSMFWIINQSIKRFQRDDEN